MTQNQPPTDHLHLAVETAAGDLVQVILDHPANVHLMDSENYDNYRDRRQFRYYGGYATESPVEFRPPHPGTWHVVVDLGGGPGKVRASVQVVPEGWEVFHGDQPAVTF